MVFVVEMDVRLPGSWSEDKIADYLKREKEASQKWQKSGEWKYLWRVAGRYSNISVIEAESPEHLHEIVGSLPLFPYMDIKVTNVCKHPNAIKETLI